MKRKNWCSMYLRDSSLYVAGLTKMASSCSDWIGLSYMTAVCFDTKDFNKAFCSFYDMDKISYEESSLSLEELFTDIFGNNKSLVEGLCHWLRLEAGAFEKVYTVSDDSFESFASKNTRYPFYMLDDFYIVEFKKMMICFIIGNDE